MEVVSPPDHGFGKLSVVYVGGIAENVSTHDVRCLFEKVGDAKDVTAVEMHSRPTRNGKAKIYAFVECTKDLAKAVAKFNGTPLPQGGGKIRIADVSEITDDDAAVDRDRASSSSFHHAEDCSTVYVGGIATNGDASKAYIRNLFDGIGEVVEVDLHSTSNGKGKTYAFVELKTKTASEAVKKLDGTPIQDGNKIRVVDVSEIKNAQRYETIPYTISHEKEEYIEFITKLRKMVSIRNIQGFVEDIFDDDKRHGAHRLLAEPPIRGNPAQWIHIEITAKKGIVTLAVRKDNLYVKGFKNKFVEENGSVKDCWYELPGSAVKLPVEYEATELQDWNVEYNGMMNLNDTDQVKRTLTSSRLGMAFAERAVCRLSDYHRAPVVENNDDGNPNPGPVVVQVRNDENPTRLGLAGLVVMICEAARMNPILDTISGGWKVGTGLTTRLSGIMWQWGSMSAALLKWKKSHYKKWPVQCQDTLGHALASIYLVLDSKAVKGPGRARVEIISVSNAGNIIVDDITVIDEEQFEHNIYKTKQGEGRPQDLDLIARNSRNISGYKRFSIKVGITSAGGSPRSIVITRTWDCLNQEADRGATELVQRTVFVESCWKINFTYLVMSNAAEARVAVRLIKRDTVTTPQGDDDCNNPTTPPNKTSTKTKYTAGGEIAACIDGFDPLNKIVLFRSTQEKACLTLGKSILTRSVFPVPYGMQRLHIVLPQIKEGNGVVKKSASLEFASSEPTKTLHEPVDGIIEFEVKVAWSGLPQEKEKKQKKIEPEVKIKVNNFKDSITKLRNGLPKAYDGKHPVLKFKKNHDKQEWVNIKIEATQDEETYSITLVVWDDKFYGVGFMNQSNVWYDLGKYKALLPEEYNSVHLGWGVNYRLILQAETWTQATDKINNAKLGKDFAVKAVRMLSRYPDVEVGEDPRQALAGLLIMFCESARFNPIYRLFESHWEDNHKEVKFTKELMDYIRNWETMSEAFLKQDWKSIDNDGKLNNIGINSTKELQDVIHLVFYSDSEAEEQVKQVM